MEMKNQNHRNYSRILLLGILFAFAPWYFELSAQEIRPTFITLSDGLASPDVREIMQDSYGLIWIATADGLQVYDGYQFETFKNIRGRSNSLLNNQVWGLTEDDERNIWIGSEQGISVLDRATHTFKNYDMTELFDETGSNGRVFRIKIDSQKRKWALTVANEILQYDEGTDTWDFAPYELNDTTVEKEHVGPVIGYAEDNHGGLYISSSRYGLLFRGDRDEVFRPVRFDETPPVDFTSATHTITEIYIDSTDVLWMATRNGVFKYNPKTGKIKTLQIYDYNQTTIWNHWNHIQPDPQGNIWITNNFRGILKFDGISDRFEELHIAGAYKLQNLGWNITLTRTMIDKSGIFWFGSRTQGLLKYDPEKTPFTHYRYVENDKSSLGSNAVFGLLASEFNPGILYVGTRGSGLDIFDQETQTFEHILYEAEEDLYGGAVRSIGENENGTLWLGTWGDGLIELNKNREEVRRYKSDPEDFSSISDNRIRIIRRDASGNFWIGTNSGLNYFRPKTGKFERIESDIVKKYPRELVKLVERLAASRHKLGEIVNVTDYQDLKQEIDIGEPGNFLIMTTGEARENFTADFGWLQDAKGDTVWSGVGFDRSYHAGGGNKNRVTIDRIPLEAGKYALGYHSDDSHSYGLWNEAAPDQTSLYGIVLVRITDKAVHDSIGSYLQEANQQLTIKGSDIKDIEIGKGYLWVATSQNGLNKVDMKTRAVITYTHDPADIYSIGSNNIFDIHEGEDGLIWITTDLGINVFDPEKEKFTRYTEEDGLPTNLTESIVPGTNGEMWIATQSGLSQMLTNASLNKVTFINYSAEDGLGGNLYLAQAAARMPDGTVYFGGDHGLNALSRIISNKIPPDIILSDLRISNKSVTEMGNESPISGNLIDVKSLSLSAEQNNLSFEFAAVHYSNPRKNQYAHMLKGYDKEWIYDNRNFATYTNLDPGAYEFMIRASNAYGVWNEEGRTIQIVISPPWYRTWVAYVGYVVLFGLILLGFDRFMRSRLASKERERAREKELKHAREIEKAYNELKTTQKQLVHAEKMASLGELTAGIAHEIQNPLNFVNNFSEVSTELTDELEEELAAGNVQLAKEINRDIKQNLEKITHHGKRADGIVKGMLQHSRSSNGLKEPTDINALADEYLRLAYHGLRAKDKSFNAEFHSELDPSLPHVNAIGQDIGRVLLNLINNAFFAVSEKKKTAPDDYKPSVTVSTKRREHLVEIRVKDNGKGIPDAVKDKIFQPFFTTKPTGEGTGLGLSLSYDIIRKGHGGDLKVETQGGEGTDSDPSGTTFIITLPVKKTNG